MAPQVNDDFSTFVAMDTATMPWQESPAPGVWRKRLELVGDAETGRMTSIVRYDPGSSFPPHAHPDGEEIFVLDGTLSDEHGDYPAGTYILNPHGSTHAPSSREGCTLFVKLRQYAGADRPRVVIDTRAAEWAPRRLPGQKILPLWKKDGDPVFIRLARFGPNTEIGVDRHPLGEEVFVLDGVLEDENGKHGAGTWFRYPSGSEHTVRTTTGFTAFARSGHLAPRR